MGGGKPWLKTACWLVVVLIGGLSAQDLPEVVHSQLNAPCTTPNTEPGTCVTLRSCEPLMRVVRNQPVPPLAQHFLLQSECHAGDKRSLARVFCCAHHRKPLPDVANPWIGTPPPFASKPLPRPSSRPHSSDPFSSYPSSYSGNPLSSSARPYTYHQLSGSPPPLSSNPLPRPSSRPHSSDPFSSYPSPYSGNQLSSSPRPYTYHQLSSSPPPQSSNPLSRSSSPHSSNPLSSYPSPYSGNQLSSSPRPYTYYQLSGSSPPQSSNPLSSSPSPYSSNPLSRSSPPNTYHQLSSFSSPYYSDQLSNSPSPHSTNPLSLSLPTYYFNQLSSSPPPFTYHQLSSSSSPYASVRRELDQLSSSPLPDTSNHFQSSSPPPHRYNPSSNYSPTSSHYSTSTRPPYTSYHHKSSSPPPYTYYQWSSTPPPWQATSHPAHQPIKTSHRVTRHVGNIPTISPPSMGSALLNSMQADAPGVDATAVVATAVDASTVDAPEVVATAVDIPAVVASAVDTPSVVASPVHTPAVVASAVDTPSVVASAVDTPSVVASAVDTPSVVASPVDTPSVVASAVDAPASEAAGADDAFSHPHLHLLPVDTCGPPIAIDADASAAAVRVDDHPWVVLLQYENEVGEVRSMCGGVLISTRYVLTAAHCLSAGDDQGYQLVTVLVGEHDTASDTDCEDGVAEGGGDEWCAEPAVEVAVERQVAHPEYSERDGNQLHDVALLRLEPHVLTNHGSVTAVCLPLPRHAHDTRVLDNDTLLMAGWGVSANSFGRSVKLQGSTQAVSLSTCASAYASRHLHAASQMCATTRNATACVLDSGGALTRVDMTGRVVVAGVASYGTDTCGNRARVFTRVAKYTEWILDQLEP